MFGEPWFRVVRVRPRRTFNLLSFATLAASSIAVGSVALSATDPEPMREFLGTGLNPIVQAASPLLLLAGQLRGTLAVPDLAGLRRHALDEIRRFNALGKSSMPVFGDAATLCAVRGAG